MRCLTKNPVLNSAIKLEFPSLNFSTLYKRKPPSKPETRKTPNHPALNKHDSNSLFSEITKILGAENRVLDISPPLHSVSSVSAAGLESIDCCEPDVCENAGEKNKESVTRNSLIGEISRNGDEVSKVVHKITQIVRADNAGVYMEKWLDDSSCEINSEVVCKVLKRCFKVPHLAKKFFNWVRLNHADCLTTESYNTMLYVAGETREFEMAEMLVDEMRNYKCKKDIKTWTILLLHYGKAKLVGKALLVFEKIRRSCIEPDADAYRLMIRLLCECRKGEIALEFYKEMVQKDIALDIKLYGVLLNCLAGCRDIDGVYLVADNMIKVSQIPENETYSYVLKSFCVSQQIREALELIRDLKYKNLTLSPVYYATLVKGLCKADKMDDALEIVDIMKKINIVDEVVYGSLISSYLRKKETSKALDLFCEMKDSGFLPLTSTYTELMQHLFNVNEYDKGSVLFDEMLERGVKLDSLAYMAMISGHVRHGNISSAWDLFKRMEEQGIGTTQKSYSIFVKELCRVSETNEIINVLRKMQDSKVTIGKEISHCLISYLERKKRFMKSEEVKEIQRLCRYHHQEVEAPHKVHPNRDICTSHSNNVTFDVKLNNVKSNVDCLLLETHPSTSDEDLRTICNILSSSTKWSIMQEALEKCGIHFTPELITKILHICSYCGYAVLNFFSWVRNQPFYRHTVETYNMAIKIAGRGKDFKYMRNLFYEMQRNGCAITSDTWTIIIMSYGRVGLTDIALGNFSEMKASGFKPTRSTYKYLILSLCGRKGGNVEEAEKLFKDMMTLELVPDKELVEAFFDSLCRAGKFEAASKYLNDLIKIGFTSLSGYSLLIRVLCRSGKVEEALALADNVNEDRSTLDCYISGSLVHGLLKSGQTDEAVAKLDSMKGYPSAHAYTSLISHFCKEKKMDRALEILKKMWEEGCHPTVVTYTVLMHGLVNSGSVDEARKLFRRMRIKGPFPDFKAYTVWIAGLCEVGKSEEAVKVLSEMEDDGVVPSSVNFRTVFFGLNREGKWLLAQTLMQQKRETANRRKLLH